jgi:hypothetical protein
LEREDYRMSVYRMPDNQQDGCTQMMMGTYEDAVLPTCFPVCQNIFGGAQTLKVTGTCDGCIEGGSKSGGPEKPCDCSVECIDGTFAAKEQQGQERARRSTPIPHDSHPKYPNANLSAQSQITKTAGWISPNVPSRKSALEIELAIQHARFLAGTGMVTRLSP